MKCYFTLALSLLAATAGSAYAENPYAPTGNETVIGQTQVLSYNGDKTGANTLSGTLMNAPEGWSMQCMNETKNLTGGISLTVNGQKLTSIKLSNKAQNTVTIPEGYVVNAVTIYSYVNKTAATTRPVYWGEVNGTKYTSTTDYLTCYQDGANPDVSYFRLNSDSNVFTFTNEGEQVGVVLIVDYSEKKNDTPVDPGFGEGALAVSNVWPANENTMLPLNGEFVLTFPADVTVAGKADLNGTALDMTAETTTVKIPYTNLAAATEYTLTIPAKAIGNSEAANEAITYTFTTRPANVLFYSDFNFYPFAYYEKYGLPFITANKDILAKGSTNKTAEAAGMTFFSGTSGRVVALKDNVCSTDPEVDYGPNTDADLGASNRSIQLIGGGNGLYVEFPEIEGPADVTFFIANANANAAAGTIVLTDELGNTDEPLTRFDLPAAKRISKFTYTYPYKGTVKLRVYNMKNQININDVMIIKGEGEGIDKPVITDEEAPVLVKSWPNAEPYAPAKGDIVLYYNEPVVIEGKALVNGVETDVVVDGTKATISYEGLEKGKSYTVSIPAVADEAGNELPASEITLNTIAEDVLYYTDYGYFPYEYWDKYNMYPADGVDNGDIFAKNSADKEVEIGGIKYVVGSTAGRVVAMGKSNLLDDPDEVGGSQRCAQFSGGGNGLYMELPEVLGPCKLSIIIGNSTSKAFDFTLSNAASSDEAIATFSTTADKKMFKFEHTVDVETPVKFRLFNNGNQFNLHDVLLTKVEKGGTVGVAEVVAEAEGEAVYYNLQGVRVENPAEGLYIRVKGNKVEKVIL